jgi:phage shock protein PspC (stress-responsive transcriptional regulator)
MVPSTIAAGLLGGPAHYLQWGVFQISLTNLLVIIFMIAVFVLALVLPFPHAHDDDADGAGTGRTEEHLDVRG